MSAKPPLKNPFSKVKVVAEHYTSPEWPSPDECTPIKPTKSFRSLSTRSYPDSQNSDLDNLTSVKSLLRSSSRFSSTPSLSEATATQSNEPIYLRIFNSFRQNPDQIQEQRSIINSSSSLNLHSSSASDTTSPPPVPGHGKSFDIKSAIKATAKVSLARNLKNRHLQMIAFGGSIGAGLFVGLGHSLTVGGPLTVLAAFVITGVMIYFTMQALGELSALFPVAGSYSAFSTRFLDPAWGFAMGWNYTMQWLVTLPLEVVTASQIMHFWNKVNVPTVVWVTLFLSVIFILNLFDVKVYGEAEFVFSTVKVIAIVGFILLGIIININGDGVTLGKEPRYIGIHYWKDPGSTTNGIKGLLTVLVLAAFTFGGTELVGLAAAETANPTKSIPTAIRQVFWRISVLYLVSILLIGLLLPYNDPRLLGFSDDAAENSASPFVLVIQDSGIAILPSIMNFVILIAVISVGNSSVFASSRTLVALAQQKQAPKIFAYVDRKGRPLAGILFAFAIGLLAFMAGTKYEDETFNWLLAISGLSSLFTWGSTCLAHIRFRQAWIASGRSVNDLVHRSRTGTIGSWIGLALNIIILISQFWTGAAPIGFKENTFAENVYNFFSFVLAVPVVVILYIGYKVYNHTSIVRLADMDLKTGLYEHPTIEKSSDDHVVGKKISRVRKVYGLLC